MSEFTFVVKCFAYTLAISFLMQIKVAGVSLEAHTEHLLKNSRLTTYLQDASAGGARLLQEGYYSTKNFVTGSVHSLRSSDRLQESRASK